MDVTQRKAAALLRAIVYSHPRLLETRSRSRRPAPMVAELARSGLSIGPGHTERNTPEGPGQHDSAPSFPWSDQMTEDRRHHDRDNHQQHLCDQRDTCIAHKVLLGVSLQSFAKAFKAHAPNPVGVVT